MVVLLTIVDVSYLLASVMCIRAILGMYSYVEAYACAHKTKPEIAENIEHALHYLP